MLEVESELERNRQFSTDNTLDNPVQITRFSELVLQTEVKPNKTWQLDL